MSEITTIQVDKTTLQKLKDLKIFTSDDIELTTLNQKILFLLSQYNKNK